MAGMSELTASQRFQAFANPARFMALSDWLLPLCALVTAVLLVTGLYLALFDSPADYQQGETVRIMYIHVPSAWLAMFGYMVMAGASAVALIFRHPLADIAAKSAAPIGAAFTFLALVTGSLWGRPMWGTWWVWDARLTSMLILFFLYLGYIALAGAEREKDGEGRLTAIFGLVGAINLPIIHYSVVWWKSLHQGQSIDILRGTSAIAPQMLWPLLGSAIGFTLLFAAVVLMRMRGELARMKIEARMKRMAAQ